MQYTRYIDPSGSYRRAPVSNETSFDGHYFSDHNVVVERIHDSTPDMRESLEENVGRHGSSLRSLYMEPREIELECRMFLIDTQRYMVNGETMRAWNNYEVEMQNLMEELYTTTDRRLILRNHPSQYYMAHLKSFEEGDRDEYSVGFTLVFMASDPLRYAVNERSLVVSSGDSQEFEVGGTDESKLIMEMRNCSSDVAVELYDYSSGTTYKVEAIDSGNVVSFDCVNHVVRRDGSITGVTLSSRWPIFTPGKWRARPTGGKLTMNWKQSYR